MKEFNKIPQVMKAIEAATPKALDTAAIIVEGSAVLRCPVGKYPNSSRVGGNLRSSITHQVLTDYAKIGTNVDYSVYVEYGTRKMSAQPYLRPALDENKGKAQKAMSDIYQSAIKGVV